MVDGCGGPVSLTTVSSLYDRGFSNLLPTPCHGNKQYILGGSMITQAQHLKQRVQSPLPLPHSTQDQILVLPGNAVSKMTPDVWRSVSAPMWFITNHIPATGAFSSIRCFKGHLP